MKKKATRQARNRRAEAGVKKTAASRPNAGSAGAGRRERGLTDSVLNAPQTLWKTGLSVLSRGGKLAAAPVRRRVISESVQDGLRKLEGVFDQRVLDSLARASMPAPQELRDLIDRVAALELAVRGSGRLRGKK